MTGKARDSDKLPRPITDHRMDVTIVECDRCGTPLVEIGPLDEEPEP